MKLRLLLAVAAGLAVASPAGRSLLVRLRSTVRPGPAAPTVALPPSAPLSRASSGTDVAVEALMQRP